MPGQGRRLETVLFLDIVGSTDVAAAVGDREDGKVWVENCGCPDD